MKHLLLITLLMASNSYARPLPSYEAEGSIKTETREYLVAAEIRGIPAEQMYVFLLNNGGKKNGNGAHDKLVVGKNISCYSEGKEKIRMASQLIEKDIFVCDFVMTHGGELEPNTTDGTGPTEPGITVGN